MAISLTSEAAKHVSRQLASRGQGEGIRIGVSSLKASMSWSAVIFAIFIS